MKIKYFSGLLSTLVFAALLLNFNLKNGTLSVGHSLKAQGAPPGVCEGYRSTRTNLGPWYNPEWTECCEWTGNAIDGCNPKKDHMGCDVVPCELTVE